MTRPQAIRRVMSDAREAGDTFATVGWVIAGGVLFFVILFFLGSL